MNYLLARIRDRRCGMRCILSNQNIYVTPDTLDSAISYAPDDSLEDGEWFFLDNFSQRSYCLDIQKSPTNGTAYASITDDEFDIISFLCAIQDDGLIYFQRVAKTQLLRQKRVVFGDSVKFEDNTREIVINSIPDAIYRVADDRLFFQKLSSITTIFHGIDEIFREATDEETSSFLTNDFIVTGESYNSSCVKKPNRKRIALANEALNSYDSDQKVAVLQSIRIYYPSIINDDNSFKIDTDDDLTYLLYGILQRYYTTADGREKLIASSVRKF
jgi:signal peptidase I